MKGPSLLVICLFGFFSTVADYTTQRIFFKHEGFGSTDNPIRTIFGISNRHGFGSTDNPIRTIFGISNRHGFGSTDNPIRTTFGISNRHGFGSTDNPIRTTFGISNRHGFGNTEKPLITNVGPKTTPDVPYTCLYGICNGTCCESNSIDIFFDCADGQKINRSLVCNRVNDCKDGSDESICRPWPSKITVLPKHKVQVHCGSRDTDKSGTLILECESAGRPIPVISWKKYDGHVPSKCQQFSKGGYGILTCPNFQQSDQGAYSCVADNSVKAAESQPKSLAKCSNTIPCHNGFKVIDHEQIEHCVECYCSGKTSKCQNIKSNTTAIKIPFTENPTEIFAKDDGQILFLPTKTELTPNSKIRNISQGITYCSLSEGDFQKISFLKSFGRSIIIPRYQGKTNFMKNAPDLIIRGNGISLLYTANLLTTREWKLMDVSVRFWPGNWHHLNKKEADRKDLMKVLSNVDSLFIRCEYEQGSVLSSRKNAFITVESSTIKDSANSISYIEKCNCPSGYDGLSCETCAAGYERKPLGNDFICQKIYIPTPLPCKQGYVNPNCSACDTSKGYYRKGNECVKATCHPIGSTSLIPDTSKKCICRERVVGDLCDRCKNDSFYLHKARGCLKCWCSGVTDQCHSSNFYRTVISHIPRGGYNSSDGRNFWLLPFEFNGNRLTSYGGSLNYTIKYAPGIQKEITYLTVELLSTDDVTLIYTHTSTSLQRDTSLLNDEKFWSVPLIEIDWKKSDNSTVTRDAFLSVLSKIKAVYIESPYHLSSGKANLTSARMSSASKSGDGENELALAVEQCNCPRGYTGLSCEKCSDGYYRKRNGTITQCIKCNCTYCDPDFGCPDCPELMYRDNPEEEKLPVCKPCPCNGRGISCVKDDHNQIFCRCKPTFSGMHCENTIPQERNDIIISISPRIIKDKKVGTAVFINCTVLTGEEMSLTAKRTFHKSVKNDSKILSTQGSRITEHFEIILEAGLETIECTAYDIQGRVAGHVVSVIENLIHTAIPVHIENCYSDIIYVKESESREIICQATGSPPPIINWYKMTKGSKSVKVDTLDGVHTIESASLKDNETVYTCVAENSEGDMATCAQVLIVLKKCEVVNIFPKHVRAIEGENISILCKTTAKGPVVWSLLQSDKKIFSTRVVVENGYLLIKNATVGDSGTYVCSAKGDGGNINQTVAVVVEQKKIPPSVSISEFDKTLKTGESFDVNCEVTGKPTPSITWRKVNDALGRNVIVTGKTLQIKKAILSNSGLYVCEARSISGVAEQYISIKVEQSSVPPRVNISETEIKGHKGDVITLNCLAIGYPRPIISWYSGHVPINFTMISRKVDEMVLIEPNQSIEEKISFKLTKEMDGLTLNCFAESAAGRDEKSVVIQVLHEVIQESNETVELVPIGSYFELQCDTPGNIMWDKVGGKVGDECPIPNGLMIPSVQIHHNGKYLCKVESKIKKVINLIVVGFVPKFSKVSRSYLVLPNKGRSLGEARILMSFRTTHENGMLLQDENSELDIYLQNRKIHFKGKSMEIKMNEPVELWSWYSLVVSVSKTYVDITIYDEMMLIHERKTEHSNDIDVGFGGGSFYVGGPIPKSRNLRRMYHPYFDGCISRLSINHYEYNIVNESSYSHNVTLCRMCFEGQNPCEIGKCFDAPTQRGFICVCSSEVQGRGDTCPASCSGKGCETQLDLCALLNPCKKQRNCANQLGSLQCRCDYGYTGNTCEKAQEYSFCVNGDGYVELPSSLLERPIGGPEIIRMAFTLHSLSGQLLWQGDGVNHLSLAVRDGILEYVYLNQHTKLEVRRTSKLLLNQKHLLGIRRINSTVTMELEQSSDLSGARRAEVYKNSTSKYNTNRVTGNIYLGNVPDRTRHFRHHPGLKGCIHYVSFGEQRKIIIPEMALEKHNVFKSQQQYDEPSSSGSDEFYVNDPNSVSAETI